MAEAARGTTWPLQQSARQEAKKAADPSVEDRRAAAELVDEADRLVGEVLAPGRWPQAKTVGRFFDEGRLERLLSLYGRAMALDPTEPAYPWNLYSVLRRLGQLELAQAFLARAIHAGEERNEPDYCGPDAYLALAEIAMDAGDTDQALVAIARAREPGRARPDTEKYAQRLLSELAQGKRRRGSGVPLPELLARMSA